MVSIICPWEILCFYNRITYLIGAKSGITYLISHNYAKTKVDSYPPLPLKKHWLCGLCYFTTHDPTIHDPTMQDPCINYPNQFKLCRKKYKHYVTRATFCWT